MLRKKYFFLLFLVSFAALAFRPMPKLDTTLIRFTEDPKTYQPYIDHLTSFLEGNKKISSTLKITLVFSLAII
jgi:16S rRNA A1518/A1519 N6-dimethyltransferase RsmA/KsgA/DIM1 with predicted DNA glycosylase/AP lyase activity